MRADGALDKPGRMVEVQVEFDYDAELSDELTIRVGDIITDVKQMDGGWWEGSLNGARGMFPDNFVRVISSEGSGKASKSQDRDSQVEAINEGVVQLRKHSNVEGDASGKKQCRVLFSYTPNHDDELELKLGDMIDFLNEVEDGWWRGELKGRVGVFPSNFVELVQPRVPLATENKANVISTAEKKSPSVRNESGRDSSMRESAAQSKISTLIQEAEAKSKGSASVLQAAAFSSRQRNNSSTENLNPSSQTHGQSTRYSPVGKESNASAFQRQSLVSDAKKRSSSSTTHSNIVSAAPRLPPKPGLETLITSPNSYPSWKPLPSPRTLEKASKFLKPAKYRKKASFAHKINSMDEFLQSSQCAELEVVHVTKEEDSIIKCHLDFHKKDDFKKSSSLMSLVISRKKKTTDIFEVYSRDEQRTLSSCSSRNGDNNLTFSKDEVYRVHRRNRSISSTLSYDEGKSRIKRGINGFLSKLTSRRNIVSPVDLGGDEFTVPGFPKRNDFKQSQFLKSNREQRFEKCLKDFKHPRKNSPESAEKERKCEQLINANSSVPNLCNFVSRKKCHPLMEEENSLRYNLSEYERKKSRDRLRKINWPREQNLIDLKHPKQSSNRKRERRKMEIFWHNSTSRTPKNLFKSKNSSVMSNSFEFLNCPIENSANQMYENHIFKTPFGRVGEEAVQSRNSIITNAWEFRNRQQKQPKAQSWIDIEPKYKETDLKEIINCHEMETFFHSSQTFNETHL